MAVERDDLQEATRPDGRIEAMLAYATSNEAPKILLFGGKGSGKSTELTRIGDQLAERHLIVGVSIADNVANLQKVTAEEIVVIVALAIAKAGREIWGLKLDEELKRLDEKLEAFKPQDGPTLSVPDLLTSLVLFGSTAVADPTGATGFVLKSLAEVSEKAFQFDVPLGGLLRKKRDPKLQDDLMGAVGSIIRSVTKGGTRSPLVLVDELDKITDTETSDRLFADPLLREFGCPVVFAAPNMLLSTTRLRTFQGLGYEIAVLYHISCWQRQNPTAPDARGRSKLREVVRRRVEAIGARLEDLITNEALEILVLQSGGVIRDLVRLVGIAARQASDGGAEQIEESHVSTAVAIARQPFEHGLSVESLSVLTKTAKDRMIPDSHSASELLRDNFILIHHDGRIWYYPHAILLGYLAGDL